jgi:hypothetical protein
MSLVEDTGFDAIDGGSIAESWQQPGTPGYCAEQTIEELQSALKATDRSRAPHVRDAVIKEVLALGDKLTDEDLLRFNRKLSA